MIRTIHRAKYVLAESDLLLQNAAVHVTDPGRISRVEPWQSPPDPGIEVVDWGSAVIMPGLVNAHAHLELSRLNNQLGAFNSFTGWLSHLIEKRRHWTPEDYIRSATDGALQSVRSGTTLVGDISTGGLSRQALKPVKLRKVVFEEILALSPNRVPESIARLEAHLGKVEQDSLLRSGVSPHAPYTVSPELYRALAELARQRDLPLATHVAETESELVFLKYGTGEFRDFLSKLGALPADWVPPGLPPVAYLERLGILQKAVVLIHCNYLDWESMSRILNSHSSVVYCPRSSAFFGRENHPVRELLDMGVNVALGTDSLASNDSLSILDEMRFLSRLRKDLTAEEILRMATLNGAAALHFGGQLGRLERGYWADMTILELKEAPSSRNLVAQILEGAGDCGATIVQGDIAWSRVQQV